MSERRIAVNGILGKRDFGDDKETKGNSKVLFCVFKCIFNLERKVREFCEAIISSLFPLMISLAINYRV